MHRQGLADIGETLAVADVTGRDNWSEADHRDILAGMVATGPARIAAMIGGDHRQIARSHEGLEARQPAIKDLQCCRVTGNIAAMPIQHVKINEIGQNQRVVQRRLGLGERAIKLGHIAVGLHLATGASVGVDVADLAGRNGPACSDVCSNRVGWGGGWCSFVVYRGGRRAFIFLVLS